MNKAPSRNDTPSQIISHIISVRSKVMAVKVEVKFSRYRPGVAQRVGRGIALLFLDHGTRRG